MNDIGLTISRSLPFSAVNPVPATKIMFLSSCDDPRSFDLEEQGSRVEFDSDKSTADMIPCLRPTLRAYSFGHPKSAKSSENGGLCREKFQLPKELEF